MAPLPLFFTAMFLLSITPGPDMLYVVARSAGQGRAAGLTSALGIGAGTFFHIFVRPGGSAPYRPCAYDAVRYAGAAYLIFLGVRTLLARKTPAASRIGDAMRNRVGESPLFRWLTGGVFIGLWFRLAVAGRR